MLDQCKNITLKNITFYEVSFEKTFFYPKQILELKPIK